MRVTFLHDGQLQISELLYNNSFVFRECCTVLEKTVISEVGPIIQNMQFVARKKLFENITFLFFLNA